MPNPFFRFRQFAIRHDRCAMKVGTDGVLLGAWVSTARDGECVEAAEDAAKGTNGTANEAAGIRMKVLDVGTGSGLVALMLAQRFPHAEIEGIDIDEASVSQAMENVKNSVFSDRITVANRDYKDISLFGGKYDLIVSNPPFYRENTMSGNVARDAARHTSALPFDILVANTARLLLPSGVFAVIIPYQSASDFISICVQEKLYITRRMDIKPTPQKLPNRTLLAFSPAAGRVADVETRLITLYDTDNRRTEEYATLTKDFYL